MKKLMLLGMAAVLLAGCDQIPFFKVSGPHRKPGLWERTDQREAGPTITTQWCYDAASDRRASVLPRMGGGGGGQGGGQQGGGCSKHSVSKNGDQYVVDSVCDRRGATITTHTVVAGDYDSRFTVTTSLDVQNSPMPAFNGHHVQTATWVYKGECPSDMSPGQVRCPNGDVVDMAALRTGGCGPGFGGGRRGAEGGGNATNSADNSAPASNGTGGGQ